MKDDLIHLEETNFLKEDGAAAKVEFWFSDENRPFLICEEVEKMIVSDETGSISVYNQDYKNPIFVVKEWDHWKQL